MRRGDRGKYKTDQRNTKPWGIRGALIVKTSVSQCCAAKPAWQVGGVGALASQSVPRCVVHAQWSQHLAHIRRALAKATPAGESQADALSQADKCVVKLGRLANKTCSSSRVDGREKMEVELVLVDGGYAGVKRGIPASVCHVPAQ